MFKYKNKVVRNSPVPGMGLPIGNLTSQFLANVYLDPFDHWIKETKRMRFYVRYMDDFVVFHDSKRRLLDLQEEIRSYFRLSNTGTDGIPSATASGTVLFLYWLGFAHPSQGGSNRKRHPRSE